MKFKRILPYLLNGKRIRRDKWVTGAYIYFHRGHRKLYLNYKTNVTPFGVIESLRGEDIVAKDWRLSSNNRKIP